MKNWGFDLILLAKKPLLQLFKTLDVLIDKLTVAILLQSSYLISRRDFAHRFNLRLMHIRHCLLNYLADIGIGFK